MREIVQWVVLFGSAAVNGIFIGRWYAHRMIKNEVTARWYHPLTAGLLAALVWQFIWLALQWLMGI